MKIRIIRTLASAFLLSLALPSCRSLPEEIDRAAPVRSIIEKALDVYGGAGAYHALRSLRKEATVTYLGGKKSQTGRFLLEYAAPDRLRVEGEAGERRVVQVQDGATMHEWVGGVETGRDISRELSRRLDGMFILGLFEGGEEVGAALNGTPRVAGRPTAALAAHRAGTLWTVYIDLETYLVRRIQEQVTEKGGAIVIDTYLDDHRFVEGRPFAWHFVTLQNGAKVQEARVSRIEVDPEIPESHFRRP